MRFRVERDALADALAWVARALPSRPVVPVLTGLRLDAGDGLTLSCFDYEVSATVRLEAEVAAPGSALVPGRLLTEITRSLPPQPAEFALDGDMVSLTCGSAEFAVVSLPIEEHPALPPTPPAAGVADGGDLAEAIGQVSPAVSRDDSLPMLTGVCLDVAGEALTLAATDRYRLAARELRWEPAVPGLRGVALVPARTLADASRIMAPGTPVTVGFHAPPADSPPADSPPDAPRADAPPVGGDSAGRGQAPAPAAGMISFASGDRRLTTRLISGEFIRYQSRFPREFGCRADVPAGPFTEAVRRVSLVAERASPVRLTFSPERVVVEARTEGRARAVETVPATFTGDEPAIAFNPAFLLDGLVAAAAPARSAVTGAGAAPDQDLLRLEFTSPARPALITRACDHAAADAEAGSAGESPRPGGAEATGSPAFRYLLVPLRARSPG